MIACRDGMRAFLFVLVVLPSMVWGSAAKDGKINFDDAQLVGVQRNFIGDEWAPFDHYIQYSVRMAGNPWGVLPGPLSWVVGGGTGQGDAHGTNLFQHGEMKTGQLEFKEMHFELGLKAILNRQGRWHPSLAAGVVSMDMEVIKRNHPKIGDGNAIVVTVAPNDQKTTGFEVGGWAEAQMFYRCALFGLGSRPWFEVGATVGYSHIPVRFDNGEHRNAGGVSYGVLIGVSGF